MNKKELTKTLAQRTGSLANEAAHFLDAFLNTVEQELRSGGEVSIAGFGKFDVSERNARAGTNPQTGQRMKISASRTPKFSAGKSLKDSIKAAG